METIKKGKSAGGPGKDGKGRAFGSSGAQAQVGHAQDAIKPALVVLAPLAEKMGAVKCGPKAMDTIERLMRSENGDAKEIIAHAQPRIQIQVVSELARIYSTDHSYARNGKALTLVCCTMGIGWEMMDRWRERHGAAGEIRLTDSEKEYVKSKIQEIKENISETKGGIK